MNADFQITWIPLAQLRPATWNANRVPPATLAKVRASIETFGIVENLVVRPIEDLIVGAGAAEVADIPVTQPVPAQTYTAQYEVISGNHRLGLYRELGIDPAPCHVKQIDVGQAILLGEALNHVRGANDPDAYNAALRLALETVSASDVTALINETTASLDKILGRNGSLPDRPAAWQSRYELVVECEGEEHQQQLYQSLTDDGLTVRVLSM